MVVDLILGGSLMVSLYWNARLYVQREDLARENSSLLFRVESVKYDLQRFKASALLARFRSGPSGPDDHLGISGDSSSHVPVKSMEG
jgi:hypothetical protein